jgi:hypothetical protein
MRLFCDSGSGYGSFVVVYIKQNLKKIKRFDAAPDTAGEIMCSYGFATSLANHSNCATPIIRSDQQLIDFEQLTIGFGKNQN